MHIDFDLDFIEGQNDWLFSETSNTKGLPEDFGVDYEPPKKSSKQALTTVAYPDIKSCFVCKKAIPENFGSQRKTCSSECNKEYRRSYMQQHRSARFSYSCIRCENKFEVGFSMWDEVRSRGMTCSACHAATAPERGRLLTDARVFKIRPVPCRNCVHSYREPAAYSGYACKLNAQICVPHIHAKLFVSNEQ